MMHLSCGSRTGSGTWTTATKGAYRSNRGRSLLLAVVGKKPMSEGCAIAAAHVDSPRMDLKPL
ncbi:MAG: hypothetical protein IKM83_02160, partial [Paludibacteraceae bacterium]|nr:hypothetical protein [Paludibacteraceae bacterium]